MLTHIVNWFQFGPIRDFNDKDDQIGFPEKNCFQNVLCFTKENIEVAFLVSIDKNSSAHILVLMACRNLSSQCIQHDPIIS